MVQDCSLNCAVTTGVAQQARAFGNLEVPWNNGSKESEKENALQQSIEIIALRHLFIVSPPSLFNLF